MTDFSFDNIYLLALLLLVPVLLFIIFRYKKWKLKRRQAFADERFQNILFQKETAFGKILPLLYALASLLLILAMADVAAGNEEVQTRQRVSNVVFLLDLSNSMNAQDVDPSRLDRAKNIMINALPKIQGSKVGIVVFAGDAYSIMPLTNDLSAAEKYIQSLSTDVVRVQGTDFLLGMERAAEKFKNIKNSARKVVLLSDGEDNEGNENAAIRVARREAMSVAAVGIGTEQGAPVPDYLYGELMGYKMDFSTGETVVSSRQTAALKEIASATSGEYIDGNTLQPAVDEVVSFINSNNTGSLVTVKTQNTKHYYQYFLAGSLFFFLLIFLFNPKKDFNL